MLVASFISFIGLQKNLVRLNTNGSINNSFNGSASTAFNGAVMALALQPDGKLLAGGFFTAYNGTNRNGIARLNTDGSLDPGFDAGTGFSRPDVQSFSVLSNGQVLVGGSFNSYKGSAHQAIIRLNSKTRERRYITDI